jgi:hypothetical protein
MSHGVTGQQGFSEMLAAKHLAASRAHETEQVGLRYVYFWLMRLLSIAAQVAQLHVSLSELC